MRGNVHTGATPPWLREEDSVTGVSKPPLIGPSLEEFILHSKQQADQCMSECGETNPCSKSGAGLLELPRTPEHS